MTINSVTSSESYNAASSTTAATAALDTTGAKAIGVFVRWDGGSTTCTLADTAGNTYTSRGVLENALAGTSLQQFSCDAPTSNAANVVTATLGAARTERAIIQYAILANGTVAYTGAPAMVTADSTATVATAASNIIHPSAILAGHAKYNAIAETDITGSGGGAYTLATVSGTKFAAAHKITAATLSTEVVTGSVSPSTTYHVFGVMYFLETGGASPPVLMGQACL